MVVISMDVLEHGRGARSSQYLLEAFHLHDWSDAQGDKALF